MSFRNLGIAAAAVLCISSTACGKFPTEDDFLLSKKDYVTVSPDKVDPANDGKLVLVQGPVTGSANFNDPDFGISEKGLMFRRDCMHVEIEQGMKSKIVTITRIKKDDANGPFFFNEMVAPTVRLGAYTVSPELLRLGTRGQWTKIPIANLDKIPASKFYKLQKKKGGEEYFVPLQASRSVDERGLAVAFGVLPNPGEATILAMQSGDQLKPVHCGLNKLNPVTEDESHDRDNQQIGNSMGLFVAGRKSIEELRPLVEAAEEVAHTPRRGAFSKWRP